MKEASLHWKLIRTVPEGSPEEVLISGESPVQVEPYTVTRLHEIRFVVPEVQGPMQLWVWVEDPSGRIRARNCLDLESFSAQRPYEARMTPEGVNYTVRLSLDSYSKCEWSGGHGTASHPAGVIPLPIRGLIQAVKTCESLTVQAAVEGSRRAAMRALMAHPLVPSWEIAKPLLDDLLTANRLWLPWAA